MSNLKRTVLYGKHAELGAKFVSFSGWEMPVNYSAGIIAEHLYTRQHVTLFDICHMGEFRLKGPDAERALDYIVARSVKDQTVGSCRYNFLLNEKGGVLDDIIIYKISFDEFFIVVNAGTKDRDFEWIMKNLNGDLDFTDESDFTAKLDLQGPESRDVLIKLGFSFADLPAYYRFIEVKLAGMDILLSRTGYTGELGYEIYANNSYAEHLWNTITSDKRVMPAGLGARDTLRLEMAYPLYGHELNTDTTPIEAGFGRLIDLKSNRKFIGKEALQNLKPQKKLIGIELEGKRAAREGAELFYDNKKIGYITSGSYSPSLGKAIALAYISADFPIKKGEKFEIFLKKIDFRGCFSEIPFYKNATAKIK
ncbi:MAG TPA: glycine cleavage system aminomethyltransferase GcvT [Victivallales bacterium]|nr:glycine cleavage system aminomethyltransferase GcvT [Victivallales bacterium]HPO91262.1 glycine cleavage system aminomethyltransferase GcvT [Victivallales bacterium]HRR06275.1 glycine cleavage system aminomethyltransferase GcvT [Victivallales bacterium]HRR29611.1 glycine cleavage system aminomethyltransferase GcvT [Victivallales bacterium]HRU02103.1 glycine cleavage system aminomethyltransferase GcvT [Victivallales bacterium]